MDPASHKSVVKVGDYSEIMWEGGFYWNLQEPLIKLESVSILEQII